jgi:hypothetical protein
LNDPFFSDPTLTVDVVADTSGFRREMESATTAGVRFGSVVSKAFEGLAFKGQSLGDVMRNVALGLSRSVLRQAFRPLDQAFNGFVGGLLSGGAPLPSPFVSDGLANVVGTPALDSGVAALNAPQNAFSTGAQQDTAITFNISTPDVESFRRSETQVAAMLTRAVGAGQRNL